MKKIKSLNELVKSFKYDKKIGLVIDGNEISYEKIYKDILNFSIKLKKTIKGKKLNIGIISTNPYENIISIFSVINIGCVPIPINRTDFFLSSKHFLKEFKIKIIVIGKNFRRIGKKFRIIKFNLSADKNKTYKDKLIYKKIKKDDTAIILLTSGTTGLKKGVMLSHNNLLTTTHYVNNFMKIKKNIVEYLMAPLTNSFGFLRLRSILSNKGCLIIDSGFFNPLLMLRRLEKYNINSISGVPSSYKMLLSLPLSFLKKLRKNLIWSEIGSASMQKEVKIKLLKLFPNVKIIYHYGLTEASRSTLINLRDESKNIETVGRAAPGVNLMICDNNKKVIKKRGVVGQIIIKGKNVAKGYFNLHSKAFEGNKFYSGDFGSINKNGYVTYYGRVDDVINVGGVKINPVFLESIIDKKGAFKGEFAIFASPKKHKVYGQVIGLFVKKDKNIKNKISKINEILINYGIPKEGKIQDVIYVKKFPKTSNGKIKRKLLKYHLAKKKIYTHDKL